MITVLMFIDSVESAVKKVSRAEVQSNVSSSENDVPKKRPRPSNDVYCSARVEAETVDQDERPQLSDFLEVNIAPSDNEDLDLPPEIPLLNDKVRAKALYIRVYELKICNCLI
jgi:hypothetical protein